MLVIRGHKIRLLPTAKQEVYFAKAAGTARFAYNWGLSRWKEPFEGKVRTNWRDIRKDFNHTVKPDKPWIKEITKCAPAMAFSDLGDAMKNYFDSKKGKRRGSKVGFPAFKCKGRSKDFFGIEADKVKLTEDKAKVWVPNLGWVEMVEPLRFNGRIGNIRISRQAGNWYASIPVEFEQAEEFSASNAIVGIDLGLKTSLTLADGKMYQGPRAYPRLENRLARAARVRGRKTPGSANHTKARMREARAHKRIADLRRDWIHKITNKICQTHKVIVLEDLNVKGMLKNQRLSKHLADASFRMLRETLEYKAERHGVKVLLVDRFFPSSKRCSYCGQKKAELSLSDRMFQCENQACGRQLDRDLNASRNLVQEGLALCRAGVPGAAREITPKERRTSAKPLGRVSALVDRGSAPAQRKNPLGNAQT